MTRLGCCVALSIGDGGRILFTEWPTLPHDAIVGEFLFQFTAQFLAPCRGTPQKLPFFSDRATGPASDLPMLTLQIFGSRVQILSNNQMQASSLVHALIQIWPMVSVPRS